MLVPILIGLIGLFLFILLFILLRNFSRWNFWLLNLLIGKPYLLRLQNWIIAYQFHLILHSEINPQRFHWIYTYKQQYIPIIIRFLSSRPYYIMTLPVHLQNLIRHSKSHAFDFDSMQLIFSYFARSPIELANQYIHTHKLTPVELERLLFEMGYEERKFLEHHLPQTDPLLQEIVERSKLHLPQGYDILK